MAKLWILSVFVLVAIMQFAVARDLAETLNVSIREQLKLYDSFQKKPDAAPYAEDLKKLVSITEGALKAEKAEDKQYAITTLQSNFGLEFNKWIALKLEESQVDDDLRDSIEFYNSLLTPNSKFEDEIKATISTLQNLLKQSNLKQKEQQYMALTNSFSPEFEKFLKESSLPAVNQQLKQTAEFFDNILTDKDVQFTKEIEELKRKAEAAIESGVSLDDKTKVLQEVSFTPNKELNAYLLTKNIEYA